MKKIIFTILVLAINIFGYSQKIAEDKVDEFTKDKVVRTDWEKVSASSDLYLNVRVSKINDNSFLELKIITGRVASIDVDDDISFMFDNGDIINLKSTEYKLSNYGDGSIGLIGSKSLGFDIQCKMSSSDIEKFKTNLVKKIRINKSEGYSEDELKTKNSEKFRGLFALIY